MTLPRSMIRNGWTAKRLAALAMLLAVGVVAAWPVIVDIATIALRDQESSQVWLVPPVAAWLVWVRRARLARFRALSSPLGPVLVGVGWAMMSLGDLRLIQSMWHLGAIVMLVGCVLSVAGNELLEKFLPALAVLVFLVPVPARIRLNIAVPLESATASVTQIIFDVLGASVDRAGNLLSINGVPVTIAEACNGLRMVFALALVSYAFAFGTPLRGYVRAVILIASPLTAIACNVIRLVPTIWLYGNETSVPAWLHDASMALANQVYRLLGSAPPTSMADAFHDASGWVMLPVSFLLLLGLKRLLQWAMLPVGRFTLAYDG